MKCKEIYCDKFVAKVLSNLSNWLFAKEFYSKLIWKKELHGNVLLVVWNTVWKLRKFTLTIFFQKFCEINVLLLDCTTYKMLSWIFFQVRAKFKVLHTALHIVYEIFVSLFLIKNCVKSTFLLNSFTVNWFHNSQNIFLVIQNFSFVHTVFHGKKQMKFCSAWCWEANFTEKFVKLIVC